MKNVIVIPTFWTLPGNDTTERFDHPTPINEPGTLGRTLQSFRKCGVTDEILIIPAPIVKGVEDKVLRIVSEFPDLDIYVFQKEMHHRILNLTKNRKLSREFKKEINVDDYGSLRNVGLIMAAIKRADNAILIDDDEIIEDRDYVKKAIEFIGKKIGRRKLLGKGGYYLERDGSWMPKKDGPRWKRHWQKQKHLNKFYRNIKSDKRLHDTTVALGGNMILNKELSCNVPFDPYIPRGEDVDYVLNAKHFKFRFMLDNQMVVKHLPPRVEEPYWIKHRKDIHRFIYEREKLKYFNFGLEALDSYPKFLLTNDLEYRAVATSIEYAKYCLRKGEGSDFREGLNNAIIAVKDARDYAEKNAKKYFKFREDWVRFMEILQEGY